jgi:hypothetical protein
MVVGELEVTPLGPDALNLYFNPSDLSDVVGTAAASITVVEGQALTAGGTINFFNDVQYFGVRTSIGSVFDEFRIAYGGATMEDVVPVDMVPVTLPWEEEGLMPGDFVVSPWFGSFEVGTEDWLNHTELGWIWVGYVESPDDLWVYSYYWNSWLYSTQDIFPVLYSVASQAWLYYVILEDVGVFVYDYTTSSWTMIP